jgi:hypothetical protein
VTVDYQFLYNVATGVAAFFGGWIINNIYKAVERLDKDVRDFPITYVAKEDYREDMQEVKKMLGKIFDKLDGKADK